MGTAVTADAATLILYIVFITLFLAFVIIFPGVRRQRFTTFTSVTLSLFVGTAILVGQHGSAWHVAEVEISSAYRAFSREKVMGTLGVHIGLNAVNVTLKAMPIYNQSSDIDYNERFHWVGATQMKEDYIPALQKGLPFPILTVGEYFTVDAEGFCWGRNYREAGYYTSIFLWMAFALWVLSNLLLIVVPRYGANLVTLTGFTLLFCNLMFRADSRKQKSVSFRNGHGRNQLELPGISGFGEFAKHLRRTDSKDSSCSSLSSAPQTGAHDLRPTQSVAFHDHFNKFKRTDSESSGGSLASMGLSILSRGGSRKTGRNVVESGELPSRAMERGDSAQSFASSLASSRKDSGGSEGVARRGDEVAIVVSNRKDSLTNAVRRNSGGETTRPEW